MLRKVSGVGTKIIKQSTLFYYILRVLLRENSQNEFPNLSVLNVFKALYPEIIYEY